MRLSAEDVELYFVLHRQLLYFANQRFKVLKGVGSPAALEGRTVQDIVKIRTPLYDSPEVIDSYVGKNPFKLSARELDIVRSWKHRVTGTFSILRYLKNYTVFLDTSSPARAYGVLALNDLFEEMLGPQLPVMVQAVLLPFEGRIIHDGILAPYRITFGGGIRRRLNGEYQTAKAQFGMITALPFSPDTGQKDERQTLKFYLKNQQNRQEYAEEIETLLMADPSLWSTYYEERGKAYARKYRKQLRELEVKDAWFAVIGDTPVASGRSKKEAQENADRILPADQRKHVHLFRVKG